jgi:hypothetical protein
MNVALDLAGQRLLVGLEGLQEVGSPAPEADEKRALSMERIRLDENAVESQLSEQLPEHHSLLVFPGGVAGLADSYALCGRIQRDLGNERGSAAGCGLDRASQGLPSHTC